MQIPAYLPYILSKWDFLLTPVYLLLAFYIIIKWKKKHYSDSTLGKFIIPAFIFRLVGCVFLALIYQFYYAYGDTFKYFTGGHEIWSAFMDDPKTGWEMLTSHAADFSDKALPFANYSRYPYFSTSIYAMFKITGVVALFCFGSYMPIAIIFSMLSFWGTWLIFITINKEFPLYYKYTAISCLFIPSVVIWSNGILKEPLCMFALGVLFYSFYNLLNKKSINKSLFQFLLGTLILVYLKSYLLVAFLAAAIFWIYQYKIVHSKSTLSRIILRSLVYLVLFGFFLYVYIAENNPFELAINKYLLKGEILQAAMTSINETYGGSGYTLPGITGTGLGDFVRNYFMALNVSLFRPYLWEISNVLMLMNFMQSFATLILVIIVLIKVGVFKLLRKTFHNPMLFFSFIFVLILAPIVGFISFNFGTLVRYSIPFQPFLFSWLFILLFEKSVQTLPEDSVNIET